MKIESIRLKNFRTFKDLIISDLPSLVVFVGANGTGKTTLFDVFGFLSDALKSNVQKAIDRRGGFKEFRSRGAEGNIEIEIKFRLEIVGTERLVTYFLQIGEQNGRVFVAKEFLRYKRGSRGQPTYFLNFENGTGEAITNEADFQENDTDLKREKQTLDVNNILAIKGLGQFERFQAAKAFRNFIERWHVSDFHVNEARRVQDDTHADHLSTNGDNLASFARFMLENYPKEFEAVLKKMAQRVPGISKVETSLTEDGRVVLKFQDGKFKDPFISRYVSDGTIKMFTYLLLLHDPEPHPLLCVEEPENQLYLSLLEPLLEEFRAYTKRGGQVFITTHSPDLLNGADVKEVFWLYKKDGYTEVKRAVDDKMIQASVAQGDKLGYLWKQGYFTNVNP